MQTVSGDVVKALEAIKGSMRTVASGVTSVASAIEEQTAATNEISSNMQMAADAMSNINEGLSGIVSSAKSADTFAKEGKDMYWQLRKL
jgi:methyl-accepting chemotaxis protein